MSVACFVFFDKIAKLNNVNYDNIINFAKIKSLVAYLKTNVIIMKILDDIEEIIDSAVCPDSFPEDLNIGNYLLSKEGSQDLFVFYPSDSCDAFNGVRQAKDDAYVRIHSHGISVTIDGIKVNIHNSQIILFDCWHFDDTVEYKRSDSRAERVQMGALLAGGGIPGAVIGGVIGLATSFGKGKKHLKCDNLVLAFWDIETRKINIIELQERKGSDPGKVQKMVDYWNEEKSINEETGRKAVGDHVAGIGASEGCFGILLAIAIPSVALLYNLAKYLIN